MEAEVSLRRAATRSLDVHAPSSPGGDRLLLGGSALLLAFVALLTGAAAVDPQPSWVDASSLHGVVATVCVVITLTAAVVGVLRWRLEGDAVSLRVGVALGVLGISFVVVDLAYVLVPSLERDGALEVFGTSLTLTARGLLVVAVLSVASGSLISLRGRLVLVAATVGIMCVFVSFVPALDALRRTSAGPLDSASDWIARAALIALWTGLSVMVFVRWRRTGSAHYRWLGIMCVGFAIAATLGALATSREDLWISAATVCTTSAALTALYGIGHALERGFLEQQSSLRQARLLAEEHAARLRAEAADREERAHQARSAVLALQGATRMLCNTDAQHHTAMDPDLREAVETEIEVLRRLVEHHDPGRLVEFDLERVVRHVTAAQRVLGSIVDCCVTAKLPVTGRATETAEVIQAVLENARRHAPGSPVEIRAAVFPDTVEVRIEDRGPGFATTPVEALFGRSVSTAEPASDGLGLFVARRLMRSQGGDLRAERRAGGGAAFVLTLPRAVSPSAAAEVASHGLRDIESLTSVDREP